MSVRAVISCGVEMRELFNLKNLSTNGVCYFQSKYILISEMLEGILKNQKIRLNQKRNNI